jgi:hypothetical protein
VNVVEKEKARKIFNQTRGAERLWQKFILDD